MFLSNIGKYENFKLVKVFNNNVLLSKLISIGGVNGLKIRRLDLTEKNNNKGKRFCLLL